MTKIIILVLLFSTPLFGQQVLGTATYKKNAAFQQRQSNSTAKRKIMAEKIQKSMEELEYLLYFNENESLFFTKENLKTSDNHWGGLANTMGNGGI